MFEKAERAGAQPAAAQRGAARGQPQQTRAPRGALVLHDDPPGSPVGIHQAHL